MAGDTSGRSFLGRVAQSGQSGGLISPRSRVQIPPLPSSEVAGCLSDLQSRCARRQIPGGERRSRAIVSRSSPARRSRCARRQIPPGGEGGGTGMTTWSVVVSSLFRAPDIVRSTSASWRSRVVSHDRILRRARSTCRTSSRSTRRRASETARFRNTVHLQFREGVP